MLRRPGLGVYLVAGWPNREIYGRVVKELGGVVDFYELGVPTRNPKYDGPYIRKAHREVEAPTWLRPEVPTYAMAYWEDYRANPTKLFNLAAEVGARGVLAPDLLIDFHEDLDAYVKLCREFGLAPVFFVPGKFPHKLVERLAAAGPDFIYLGLYAATGIELPVYVERNVRIIRQLVGDVYVVAGFAVDTPAKAARLVEAGADGVVVGTAFMRRLQKSPEEALAFLREIKAALR
ncbi:tryptophan synthase subunit alpha [Pyrobaculum sp. 3827-6]|uniref:tryptophan synthase subunit alpha n=1 Tax=Pyrobaculum sp. 3827-6 TaxID=2983604 RepID=UPI0021D98374|nr:tryptophan synthase subunit alpha [Pyrobaculum sp. 3827-6]MCU7787047.1 tryptophan synthase subunit alpha [Pyrobaculum sp. 3827-6]